MGQFFVDATTLPDVLSPGGKDRTSTKPFGDVHNNEDNNVPFSSGMMVERKTVSEHTKQPRLLRVEYRSRLTSLDHHLSQKQHLRPLLQDVDNLVSTVTDQQPYAVVHVNTLCVLIVVSSLTIVNRQDLLHIHISRHLLMFRTLSQIKEKSPEGVCSKIQS